MFSCGTSQMFTFIWDVDFYVWVISLSDICLKLILKDKVQFLISYPSHNRLFLDFLFVIFFLLF